MKALLAAAKKQAAQPGLDGQWYKVVLTPRLETGERFNVGVIMRDSAGFSHWRLLADFSRLRCLYGDEIEEHTRFLLQVLREHLQHEGSLQDTPSQNLRIEGPFYASGDIDVTINSLYNTVVPLGKRPESQEQRQDSAFQSITNQKARQLVYTELDHLLGIDKTHTLIAAHEYLEIDTQEGKRHLDIPLRPYNHYGSIVSACYKHQPSIEKQLLKAQLDLYTASQLKPVTAPIGLFVLRPTEDMHLTENELHSVDNILDGMLWKIKANQFFIEADDCPRRLAESVAKWAE